MDLLSGLSAASTAISIAKDLREIDKSVDEATYKLKLAELTEALVDAKLALSEAKEQVSMLEALNSTLMNGPVCPVCHNGHLEVIEVKKWDGKTVETHTCRCSSEQCQYLTTRVFNTNRLEYRA